MKLRHWSKDPIEQVNSVSQNLKHMDSMKPKGFWISDETDFGWKKWCKDNDFRPHTLAYEYEVKLNPAIKILYIRNSLELELFTQKYALPNSTINGRGYVYQIDWFRLATEYGGIIITPYLWQNRNDSGTFWYYSWDCASGCIWDARAIKSLKLVKKWKVPAEKEEKPLSEVLKEANALLREELKRIGK